MGTLKRRTTSINLQDSMAEGSALEIYCQKPEYCMCGLREAALLATYEHQTCSLQNNLINLCDL